MAVNWLNPYEGVEAFNLKGNLHTHTDRSACGRLPLEVVLEIFKGLGFDFLSITDHNQKSDGKSPLADGPVLLPGIEIDIDGGRHFCVVNTNGDALFQKAGASQQELIDRNVEAGGLVVLNHPDWQIREHYTIDELLELKGYSGIEIYNRVIEDLEGSPLSTAKWDRLLSSGRRVLGFSNLDFHDRHHAVDCCEALACEGRSQELIFEALKAGRFYCHYGVVIKSLRREGGKVSVSTENAKLIRFIGFGGKVLKKVVGASAEIEFKADDPAFKYIRVECLGEGERISFSQPFFRD